MLAYTAVATFLAKDPLPSMPTETHRWQPRANSCLRHSCLFFLLFASKTNAPVYPLNACRDIVVQIVFAFVICANHAAQRSGTCSTSHLETPSQSLLATMIHNHKRKIPQRTQPQPISSKSVFGHIQTDLLHRTYTPFQNISCEK